MGQTCLFFAPHMMENLKPLLNSLHDYPPWFVVLCLCLVGAAAIYVFAKLIKWTLYTLLLFVVVGGISLSLWLLFK